MVRHENGEGGRWDVGFKGDAVYLERRSEDDEQVFSDRLEPEEARELASLLNKYADKAESGDKGDSAPSDESADDESDHDSDDDDDDESDDDDEDSDDKS